ncbi:MAG: hypothetical protein LBO64_00020 [Desulfovibrio sp.]|nr:hypothetical protein [Desulfovibrio sp.]
MLRSRQKTVEPETHPAGRDYSGLVAVKADYAEKQVEILRNGALAAKGKNRLLAFLRMEQAVQEEKPRNTQAREEKMTSSVDNKGAAVFTFADGGKIRDCGGEVLFSADRESLALAYARKKWGLSLIVDKGRILFDRERMERARETPLPPLRAKTRDRER